MASPLPAYRFGAFELRPHTRQLLRDGVEVSVGGRAFDLLRALAECQDRVVAQDELCHQVWPGHPVEPNNLQVQVWALRRLLGPRAIATVARRGYRLVPELAIGAPAGAEAAPGAAGADGAASADHRAPAEGMRALAARLRSQQAVTLVGPDDNANRRLALRLGRHLASETGVALCHVYASNLARADDAAGSGAGGAADGAALGQAHQADQALDRMLLRLALRGGLLLVLDAHRAGPALVPTLSTWAAQGQGLRLLVTSRVALGHPGEVVMAVPAQVPQEPPPARRPKAVRWQAQPWQR